MQKDQVLGIVAFTFFVIFVTQIAYCATFDVGQTPNWLIVSMGPVFALFIGFTFWASSASSERNKELKRARGERVD